MRLPISNAFAKTFHLSTISSSVDFCSKRFRTFTNLFKGNLKSVVPYLFTLEKDEVIRIPLAYRELQVLSGVAWITLAGEDIILSSGEKALLASKKGFAIISVLSDVPLILEAW